MTLIIYKETTWTRRISIVDADAEPFDLTDTTLDAIISKHTTDAALITLAPGDGITLRDQGLYPGQADIEVLPADVAELDPGNYVIAVGATTGDVRVLALRPTRIVILDTPG